MGCIKMNITLMEKVYKENKVVLYVNGLVGVISDKTMIDSSAEVLKALGYNIKDTNSTLCLNDEIPNNESDYRNETGKQAPVHLTETSWVHHCDSKCCFDVGCKIQVNNVDVLTQGSLVDELTSLLGILGHTVSAEETEAVLLSKPGTDKGRCLDYETDPAEEDYGFMIEINMAIDEVEKKSLEYSR